MIYDVAVVGAGPAGGQCARELSAAGHRVLLIERSPSFHHNNFSSGGAPIEIMEPFHLPSSVVGTYWNHLHFFSSHHDHVWYSSTPRGVVFDFAKLRQFLAESCEASGGTLALDTQYTGHVQGEESVELQLQSGGTSYSVEARVVVDATGSERRLLGRSRLDRERGIEATGIEYLIEVSDSVYRHWCDRLAFFMGEWMPQGYGWIFPMEESLLKVGVGRYYPREDLIKHNASYLHYLDRLIEYATQGESWRRLDRHGKSLRYTYGRKDPHTEGRIMAIGDAISMVNPIAFEGIRHGMESARHAARDISAYLNGQPKALQRIAPQMRHYCGIPWRLSERMTRILYRKSAAIDSDRNLRALSKLTTDSMHALCFHYRILPALRFLWGMRK